MSGPGRPRQAEVRRRALGLGPVAPVVVSSADVGQACMWVAAASRILEAAGMGAEAEELRRVLERVRGFAICKSADRAENMP